MPTKSPILKGIFAVGVIAVTATAGVVSFAQAARVSALDNGYGGPSAAIQAAIQAFQGKVNAAATQLNQDISACFDANGVNQDRNDADRANALRAEANADVNRFSSKFSSPGQIDRDEAKMSGRLEAAANDQDNKLFEANGRFVADLDRNAASRGQQIDRNNLRQCLRDARQDFRQTVREAQQTLLQAIRDALRQSRNS